MIKGIVYNSNTGFTAQYAEILSHATGLPAYKLDDMKDNLKREDEVIYMGWICVGKVKGYRRASEYVRCAVVCGVGLKKPDADMNQIISENNNINPYRFFMLHGGLDSSKQKKIGKVVLKMMNNRDAFSSEGEKEVEKVLEQGSGSFVDVESLKPLIAYLEHTQNG